MELFELTARTTSRQISSLIAQVKEQKADLGIAFDGDADRIGVIDEQGKHHRGDQLMILFSRAILAELPGATFVAEAKCSQTLFDDIRNTVKGHHVESRPFAYESKT